MSDRIMRWLGESQQLADQATKGPWEVYGFNVLAHLGPGSCNGCSGILSPAHLPECGLYEVAGAGEPDAEFIAEARTRFPQAVAALKAIMEKHRPIEVEPSETICAACSHRQGWGESVRYSPVVEHPCGTRRLAEAALGLKGQDDE